MLRSARMAPRGDDKETPPDAPASFATGRDGKIDGIYRPRDQRRSFTPTDDARLELAARPERKVEPLPPPPVVVRRGRSPQAIVIAVVLAIAALLLPFGVRWGMRAWNERKLRMSKAAGLILIDSTPSDARVFINGVEVGRTPYVAPNTFQPGTEVPVRLTYPAAQDWNGTFPGGVDTSFSAELQAKSPP